MGKAAPLQVRSYGVKNVYSQQLAIDWMAVSSLQKLPEHAASHLDEKELVVQILEAALPTANSLPHSYVVPHR
jgi:hypothetical protein